MKPYYIKYPIAKAIEPPREGACWIYRNRYWQVTVDNCLLFYRGTSPQCSEGKYISEQLCRAGHWVMFLPLVFVPASEGAAELVFDVAGDRIEMEAIEATAHDE